jgi:hypothetical protein
MPPLIQNTKNTQAQTTAINSRTSSFQQVEKVDKNKFGSQLPTDRSYSLWQNAWNSLVKIFQGNVGINATNDVVINANNEMHLTAHNKQETTSGTSAHYTKGPQVNISGEMSDEASKNQKKYQEMLDQIDQKKIDAIKNTKGEMKPCPNCQQQHLVDDKSDNWAIIFDAVQQYIDGIPYLRGPWAALRWFVQKIYAGIPSVKSNNGLNEGKGCGPGCKDGMKEGLAEKMTAGEKAVKDEMDRLKDEMDKLTINLNPPSAQAKKWDHGLIAVCGDPAHSSKVSPYVTHEGQHHSFPMNIRPAKGLTNKLRVTTEGNCKVVTYHPPQQSEYGNMNLTIANNLKVTAGANGMDFMSTGEIAVKGGSVHINGSQGEVSVTSGNLTTIGGANVLISADNKSGDSGVCIDSKSTYVRGAFNVNGDTAMLGQLTVDGNLNVNYLNCPTMKAPSTQNSTDAFTTQHANWSYGAVSLNAMNIALKGVGYALEPSKLMIPVGLLDLVLEYINIVLMSVPIEILDTGVFVGVCAGFGGGVCAGLVWNYPHNHTRGPESHEHDVPVPRGGYWKKASGAGQMRATGNPSPTPVSTNTTYPFPAPRTWGGGCGGGGLYSKVRNQKYGINRDDAYNGGNTVTTTVVRNYDGSLYPPPDLTYREVTDTGNDYIDKTTIPNIPSGTNPEATPDCQ